MESVGNTGARGDRSFGNFVASRWRYWTVLVLFGCLAGFAAAPQKYSSVDVFRDTRLLETRLKKGVSTAEEVKQALGAPTGFGAVYLGSLEDRRRDIWFYQDIEVTDIKAIQGQLDMKIRQQIMVIFIRDGLFDGFMWYSNVESATGWVKGGGKGAYP